MSENKKIDKGVTLYLSTEVFELLKNTDISFHGLKRKTNVGKIESLILFYLENQKK